MSGMSEGRTGAVPRRTVVGGLAAGTALLAAPFVARAQGGRQAVKVSVGRIPWAAGNSPMTQT